MLTDADKALHADVLEELQLEPRVCAGELGIAVESGIVTLTGSARSFTEKWAAEDAVKRVKGVCGLASEIVVDLPGPRSRTDTELVKTAVGALRATQYLPQTIVVESEDGSVTLSGVVDWAYQRDDALQLVRNLPGVRDVYNAVTIRPQQVDADELLSRIRRRFMRLAALEVSALGIDNHDGRVRLTGAVSSLAEKDAASWAALSVPGVVEVRNDLEVRSGE